MKKADKPFLFNTQLSLVMLTGLKAKNIPELKAHLEVVPESSVYHHTHHFLQQHQFLTPEPPNDFAYWVTNVLQEDRLGEKLASIDTVRFSTLKDLRQAILSAFDAFLAENTPLRECPAGEEFHFMRSILFSLPTTHVAHNLEEFREGLKKVSINSLYYHVFEARLRNRGMNDFSEWFDQSLHEKELARALDKLDPYTQTMEGLRQRILVQIDKRLREEAHAAA